MAHLREDGQVWWDDRWERRRQKYNLPPLYMEKVRRRLAKRYGYSLGEDPAQAPQHLPPLSPGRRTLSAVHREDQAGVPSQQQVVKDDVNPADMEEIPPRKDTPFSRAKYDRLKAK
ncbi:hypothetical protein Bbelb_114710 [Branchiostoma belcheri]|nr:hypothetical protein Bbelb_114710 [Branchiostoma belcheri]